MRHRRALGAFVVLTVLSGLFSTATASAQVTAVTLTAGKTSPRQVGTTVTFRAKASGGTGPYEYKFWLAKGGGANEAVSPDYSPESAMVWTPTEADYYEVKVHARTQGSTALYEKRATRSYYVVVDAPVKSVTLFYATSKDAAPFRLPIPPNIITANPLKVTCWPNSGEAAPRVKIKRVAVSEDKSPAMRKLISVLFLSGIPRSRATWIL